MSVKLKPVHCVPRFDIGAVIVMLNKATEPVNTNFPVRQSGRRLGGKDS